MTYDLCSANVLLKQHEIMCQKYFEPERRITYESWYMEQGEGNKQEYKSLIIVLQDI